MDDHCPAVLAIRFAITSAEQYRGRRGRPRINLFGTIQSDLKEHGINLKTVADLNVICELARNRVLWRGMFKAAE